MPHERLQGAAITLRLLKKDYIQEYIRSFSSQVRMLLHDVDPESERVYLYEQCAQQRLGKTLFYCIFERKSDRLIGAIAIRDMACYQGQLYCWLHEDFWGSGYFQEALRLVAHEYFLMHTHVSCFTAHVDIDNKRSYRALHKAGFMHAGIHHGPYGKQYTLLLRKK